ncbi:3D (Asp-Asp-Asp) domain-containing protein [Dendrosporobacter quercicolus]|uniref:3D (Asp-Asp-Asp) domain-containing protein n=2 Tax=Dendrosporobacter quercicolus TaxID=146817 RepID=A0A1G9KE24_9FIRM|nr:3D (Asp-Asp-Asp) domain-containing protein [Dendrosporobacter quercicolus]
MTKMFRLTIVLVLTMLISSVVVSGSPNLPVKYGMRGENVQIVQKMLADAGFYTEAVDGVFGGKTLQAIKSFQRSSGLIPDGIVGSETFSYLSRAEAPASRYERSLTMSASAYTAYDSGNSHYTYRGSLLRKGLAAVDPAVIPLGTRLYIPGYGYAIADDVGSSIKGNKIDLAFDSRDEALQFGRQIITVYLVE